MSSTRESCAQMLIELGCVQISTNPLFNYASGLKGPIYCDNRILYSSVAKREYFLDAMVLQMNPLKDEFDLVMGVATGGIPMGMLLADRLKKPFAYVRPKPKAHGKGQAIEGLWQKGDRVLLVEDLINQGTSVCQAWDLVVQEGPLPKILLCLVDYRFEKAKRELEKRGAVVYSLTDFESLIQVAQKSNLIQQEQIEILSRWHQNPAAFLE